MLEHHTKESINRAVLVGLHANNFDEEWNASESTLEELEALLETAGGECVGTVLQNRQSPDPCTFTAAGKVPEAKELVEGAEGDLVIFDNDLSSSQIRVLI